MIPSAGIPPTVEALFDNVVEQFPVHRRFMASAVTNATVEELDRLDTYLLFCQGKGLGLDYLAESYLTIVADTMEEQLFFNRHRRYRHSTFAEVADQVYYDRDYMDRYMYGLAISTFLWPNHVEMSRFFRRTFPHRRSGKYLEVGPGHGFLFLTALELGRFDDYLGIDLSAASIAQTSSIVEHFHPGRPVRFEQQDFLAAHDLKTSGFSAIVMGEVLEHVEHPDVFLHRIAELAADDAYIFITTCVNAPAVDHIFLWRTTEALEELIASCGLRIIEPLRLPYEGKSLEESLDSELPINVAYVLAKA